VVLTSGSNCFAQRTNEWVVLNSPTNDVLRKIFFVDINNGWASGLSGTIIHTSNGGHTWVLQNSTVSGPIVDIFFINNSRGWALTYTQTPPFRTIILKTTNGGEVWFPDSVFFNNEFISTVFFFDEFAGFLGGNGVKKTINGGQTWVNAHIDSGMVSALPINRFSFYSNTFGYACGGRLDVAGVIWRTTDGGNNWSSLGLSPDQIFDVFILDSLNAVTLSGDPEGFYGIGLIKTSDAGLTWSYSELPIFGLCYTLDFLNNQEGWSASGYKFLHTEDGGKTWTEEPTPDSTIIYDLQFVDQYTGFACGENGALLKFVSFKTPVVTEPVFDILQNYPNPFREKTTIEITAITPDFDVPVRAKIKLFDILGKELLTLADQDFYWGRYGFILNPSLSGQNLSSGVYFVTLISGNTTLSKKIIYLK
jgi:photosystem II stability/assembly factor-like uncharacterized protein